MKLIATICQRGGILLLWLGVVLLLLFLVSNLFLASTPGRRLIARELEKHHHDVFIEFKKAAWSPWDGFSLHELTARIKSKPYDKRPLLVLTEVRVHPHWNEILSGRQIFREVEIGKTDIQVPIEWVAAQRKPTTLPPSPKPAKPKKIKIAVNTEQKTKAKPTPQPKKTPPRPQPKQAVKIKEPTEEPLWVHLTEANITLYDQAGHDCTLRELEFKAPVSGPKAIGYLAWKEILWNRKVVSSSFALPVEWQFPSWHVPKTELQALGVEAQMNASFAVRRETLPFQIALHAPSQKIEATTLPFSSSPSFETEQFTARFLSSGRLNQPEKWKAEALAQANGITIKSSLHQQLPQELTFSSAHLNSRFINFHAQIPSIAVQSEELSFFGNARLSPDNQLSSVLRIVASPEWHHVFREIAIGSHLSNWTSAWLQPLITPDRLYRDIQLNGPLHALNTDAFGAARKPRFGSFKQAFQQLQSFTASEITESHLRQPTPQN